MQINLNSRLAGKRTREIKSSYEEVFRQLSQKNGLEGWTLVWDYAKTRAGQCRYSSKTISLSVRLAQVRSFEQTRNTILHEIAHALVGAGHGHNHIWKRKALEVGCNGERCTEGISVVCKWKGSCGCVVSGAKQYWLRHKKINGICPSCREKIVWSENTEGLDNVR